MPMNIIINYEKCKLINLSNINETLSNINNGHHSPLPTYRSNISVLICQKDNYLVELHTLDVTFFIIIIVD